MKSLILLAIVVTCLFVQVRGKCSISDMTKCTPKEATCKALLESMECYKTCGWDMPDGVKNAVKEAGCGASALTNLGFPVMLLIAVVAYFNK